MAEEEKDPYIKVQFTEGDPADCPVPQEDLEAGGHGMQAFVDALVSSGAVTKIEFISKRRTENDA